MFHISDLLHLPSKAELVVSGKHVYFFQGNETQKVCSGLVHRPSLCCAGLAWGIREKGSGGWEAVSIYPPSACLLPMFITHPPKFYPPSACLLPMFITHPPKCMS